MLSKTSPLLVSDPATRCSAASTVKLSTKTDSRREHSALRFGEQVVAPVDRRSQGLVTGHLGSGAGTEHPKAVMKASRNLFERQQRYAGPARPPVRSPAVCRRDDGRSRRRSDSCWARGRTTAAQPRLARPEAGWPRIRALCLAAERLESQEAKEAEQARFVRRQCATARGLSRGLSSLERPAERS